MQYILKNELGLKPLKFQKVQKLTDGQKKVRLKRAKKIFRLLESGQLPNFIFSDEKPFQIEQFVSKHNERVYSPKKSAENLHLRLATRTRATPIVMVWAAVTADDRSPHEFIDRGVKINAKYYQENVLKTVLKPWADKHFGCRPWTFEQDSAPLHSPRINQEWIKKEVLRFYSTTQWPPKSPDLNPLDFCA